MSTGKKGQKSSLHQGKQLSSSNEDLQKETKNNDALTHDKLFHIADENVEQSDNFLVKTSSNRLVRIMISDYEDFDDNRLNPNDLRKLFYLKPSIAELLYEEMLEAGLVEEASDEEEVDERETTENEETSRRGEDDSERGSASESEFSRKPFSSPAASPDRRPTATTTTAAAAIPVHETNEVRRRSTKKMEEVHHPVLTNSNDDGDEEDELHNLEDFDL
jgi:hypothetical protein